MWRLNNKWMRSKCNIQQDRVGAAWIYRMQPHSSPGYQYMAAGPNPGLISWHADYPAVHSPLGAGG